MNTSSIFEQLELVPTPLGIGETRLDLLSVGNIDPYMAELETKGEDALRHFPYWVKIWEASIVLAAHIADKGPGNGRTVLELGAGMGVVGLFLAASGYRVTLTDVNADALALMRKNAARNHLDNVEVQKLDWNDFEPPGTYDIVCGAELTYRRADIKPVVEAFRKCVKPDGTVFLAHNIKQLPMIDLLAEAGKHFEIEHAGKSITIDNKKKQFVIHTMKPSKAYSA